MISILESCLVGRSCILLIQNVRNGANKSQVSLSFISVPLSDDKYLVEFLSFSRYFAVGFQDWAAFSNSHTHLMFEMARDILQKFA